MRETCGIKMYCIYKAKNKLNGKIYVGKTNNFIRRQFEHITSCTNHLFSKAIKKYSAENFEWEIIENTIHSLDEANERERYWIDQYNSYFHSDGSNGYNMTRGGDGGSDWNLRKIASYSPDGNLIKSFGTVTECAAFYGICGTSSVSHSADKISLCKGKMFRYFDETPQKTIEPYSWENPKKIKVCKLSLSGELLRTYNGISDAEKDGYKHTGIIACIKKRYKKSYGFQWCYEKDLQNNIGKYIEADFGVSETYIYQFSPDWELIGKYKNCEEARKSIGAKSHKTIHKALNSNTHFSHGFKWLRDTNTPTR